MARGGARPNSGGKRAGAGRKPEVLPPLPKSDIQQSPLEFLLATMRDGNVDPRIRLDAAKAAAPFMHAKLDASGKKEGRNVAAGKAAKGKFAPIAPPRLATVTRLPAGK